MVRLKQVALGKFEPKCSAILGQFASSGHCGKLSKRLILDATVLINLSVLIIAVTNCLWCSAITNPRILVPAGLNWVLVPPKFLAHLFNLLTKPPLVPTAS